MARIVCFCLLNALLLPTARAGTYVLQYTNGISRTGGVLQQDSPFNSTPVPYTDTSGQGYGGSVSPYGDDDGCTASAGETITSTYVWQPASGMTNVTDPPPPCAIVHQSCTVSATAYNEDDDEEDYPGVPSVDNGLVGVTTTSQAGSLDSGTWDEDATCTGSKYYVKTTPGLSFTVTCTPSASASADTGCSVIVSYSDDVTPVLLNLTGPTTVSGGTKQILVGQALNATLSAGSYALSGYFWSVSGANPFYFWTATQYATNYADLSLESSSDSYYLAYFANSGTAMVNGSAIVSFPDGTTTVVYLETDVGVIRPMHTASFADKGSVIIGDGVTGVYSIATTPADNANSASQWVGNLSLPAPFTGQGTWTFAQTIKNERYYTPDQGSSTPQGPGTNVTGCDTSFPYSPGAYPVDGRNYDYGDSPAYALDTSGAKHIQEVDAEAFQDWILYLPPSTAAGSSMYVPIHVFNWKWQGAATYTKANDNGLPVGWHFLATPNPEIDLGSNANTTAFPFWNCCVSQGGTLSTGP